MDGEALPRTRLIVFDLDGVLVKTRDLHYEALNEALVHCGYDPIPRQEHLDLYDGLSTRRKLELLGITDERVEAYKKAYTAHRLQTLRVDRKFSGIFAHLKADGYLIGVASNAIRSTVISCLQRLQVRQHVDFVLSNEDVTRPKPHPDIYVEMVRLAGCVPQEVLVVEDRPQGVQAAHQAGCRVVQVTDPDEVTYEHLAAHGRQGTQIR